MHRMKPIYDSRTPFPFLMILTYHQSIDWKITLVLFDFCALISVSSTCTDAYKHPTDTCSSWISGYRSNPEVFMQTPDYFVDRIIDCLIQSSMSIILWKLTHTRVIPHVSFSDIHITFFDIHRDCHVCMRISLSPFAINPQVTFPTPFLFFWKPSGITLLNRINLSSLVLCNGWRSIKPLICVALKLSSGLNAFNDREARRCKNGSTVGLNISSSSQRDQWSVGQESLRPGSFLFFFFFSLELSWEPLKHIDF